MEKIKALIGVLFIILLGLILAIYRSSSLPKITRKKVLLNTYVTITVYENENKANKIIDEAFKAMEDVEKKLNRYDSSSEISTINKQAGKKVKVSDPTYKAIKLAKIHNSTSYGYFDITTGKIVSLWDFAKQKVPPKSKIIEAKKFIIPSQLKILKDNHVRISKGMLIDTGALIKGLAVDAAQKKINDAGIKNALITTGSSTTLIGKKPNGQDFKVGIQHPRKTDSLLGIIKASNVTISTSGDYQQFFYKKGVRYNHIINPKTGYPQNDFMSITVISKKPAVETDILSTTIFAMGKERGVEFAQKNSIDYILVTSRKKVLISIGAKKYIQGPITY